MQSDDAWQTEAAEMKQYIKEEYAEMWYARFKIYGVPVFYTPYFQLPIGDRRRTGLLIPDLGGSSRDKLVLPTFLLEYRPNFDATITPKYMSLRGWQLDNEFRYLTQIAKVKLRENICIMIAMTNLLVQIVAVI